MTRKPGESDSVPIRREPPPFLVVAVEGVEALGPRMMRAWLSGEELGGMEPPQPAASIRLLLPSSGSDLEIPTWNGNEFLLADGSRPIIRTFTPRRFSTAPPRLAIDMVVHTEGKASAWVLQAQPGDTAAVSGPARGYDIDPGATSFVLAGDESAIPAMAQLLEILPSDRPVSVHIVATSDFGRVALPDHPAAAVSWHEADAGRGPALLRALGDDRLVATSAVWVAGEAAAVHQVRNYLFRELELPRRQAVVRGYWK